MLVDPRNHEYDNVVYVYTNTRGTPYPAMKERMHESMRTHIAASL